MRFAFVLAWINTRVLLTLFFLLVITPVGVIMRLLRKGSAGPAASTGRGEVTGVNETETGVNPERYENLF